MFTLLSIFATPAFASSAVTWTQEVGDHAFVDSVSAAQEVSTGIVVSAETSGAMSVEDLHDGQLQTEQLEPADRGIARALKVGDAVLVYRDEAGTDVVPAS